MSSNLHIEMVVATDRNGAIGKNNRLIWHLPADLRHFRQITIGHSVVMGRKTFESIGKPLPKRTNIVISRRRLDIEGVYCIASKEELSALPFENSKIFIIGGAEVYRLFMEDTRVVHHTLVDNVFPDADTFFPMEVLLKKFIITEKKCFPSDEKNPYPYCFQTWTKK